MYLECRHIMPNGRKCYSPALKGRYFCYYHNRLHLLGLAAPAVTKPARASKAKTSGDQPLSIPFLEDKSAIQLSVSQIVQALAAGKLETRRAATLLYGLQVAFQTVERTFDVLPFIAVESVTQSSEGDELAPSIRNCNNCSNCELRDQCKDFKPQKDEVSDES